MKMKENVALSDFSNYKIGGPAKFFFDAKNEDEVCWAAAEAQSGKLPIFVLGGGTNLLIDDKGFAGLVLHPKIDFLGKKGDTTIAAGAGVSMSHLLDFAAKKSLSGLEWAGGLPGTLGGAVRGNAGCFGGEIKDVIASVRSLDMGTLKIVERDARGCGFDYRDSIFKKNGNEVILSATLHLKKGGRKAIEALIAERIAHRKKNHPLEYPNIGSIFKNVPLANILKDGSREFKAALKEGRLGYKGSEFSIKTDPFPVISTAKLISETGLRGVSLGGAMISPKHPNFIVNALNAGSHDVKSLIMLAKAEVGRKFGIDLEEEVQML